MRIKLRLIVSASALVLVLALPAAAPAATHDLAVSQSQSATVVPKGSLVTFTVDVRNVGTATDEAVFVELGSLAAHSLGADAPYQSFSTSQGTCSDRSGPAYGTVYHFLVCELGPLAPGASAQITAVVQANESADYTAVLLPNAFEGGYLDGDNSNNEAGGRVTVSTPPLVSGSRKIKLSGLPSGCAPGDFTLHAVAKAKRVKKMVASLFFLVDGDSQTWQRRANGNHLTAKVPVSKLPDELGRTYTLVIKAKVRHGGFLKTTVALQSC